MASGVSVESSAVQAGIKCCQQSVQALREASQKLTRSYQQAGSNGWNDKQYSSLGGIVGECCSALNKPVSELNACMAKLNDLLKAINEYEQVNL